jgi:DNA gyrase subunit A
MSPKDLDEAKFIVMATTKGTIKKTDLGDFENVRRSGLIAIKLKQGDSLEWVRVTTGKDEIMLVTQKGMAIRFHEDDIRGMGRVAAGVRGIRIKSDDEVVGMGVIAAASNDADQMLAVITENGYGKRTIINEYTAQKRGGAGVKTARVTPKTGKLITASVIAKDAKSDMMIVSEAGQVIRFGVNSIPTIKRATQGVRVMRFKKEGDKAKGVALLDASAEEAVEELAGEEETSGEE